MYKPHVTATGRLPDLVKLDDLQNAVCKEWKQQCDRQEKSLWNCLLMWLGVKKYPAPTVISELLFKPQLQLHFMDAFERTRIRGIIAFAAVRRYQIGHQANPARLLDAVQEAGLQEIPPDPYDGQPLRYIQRNGRPTVYAIGPDLTDNGGLYDFRFESRRPADNLFQLHDLIYDPNHPGLALPEPDEPEGPGM